MIILSGNACVEVGALKRLGTTTNRFMLSWNACDVYGVNKDYFYSPFPQISAVVSVQCFGTVGWASGWVSGMWKLIEEVLVWLSVWSKVQVICLWSSWCHCHPTISCFIEIWMNLSFLVLASAIFCPTTDQLSLEKRPLNGCLSICCSCICGGTDSEWSSSSCTESRLRAQSPLFSVVQLQTSVISCSCYTDRLPSVEGWTSGVIY